MNDSFQIPIIIEFMEARIWSNAKAKRTRAAADREIRFIGCRWGP